MLKIRLQRVGKKNQPTFRLVLTDSRNSTKSGRVLEVLGWRNPEKHEHSFNKERILYWMSKGTQLTGSVNNLLVRNGVIKGAKVHVSPNMKPAEATSQQSLATSEETKQEKGQEPIESKKAEEPKEEAKEEKTA